MKNPALLLMAALAAGALAVQPAAAQTKWNLPAAYPPDNPHSENLALFAKDVAAATNNKLQITVHAAASLFKAPEIKRAVQTGQAQIGEVLISLHENEDPIFGVDVIPFLDRKSTRLNSSHMSISYAVFCLKKKKKKKKE